MKAIWNNLVLAEAPKEDLIYIERNWYFPPDSIQKKLFRISNTPYTCPWKGECRYYDIGLGATWNKDAAFCYPEPLPSAIERVHKDFSGYMAFWRGVEIVE